MPKRVSARTSWNCLLQSTRKHLTVSQEQVQAVQPYSDETSATRRSIYAQKISVTFDMNRLQGIPMPGEPGSPGRVLVSMNPIHSPTKVKGTSIYRHPLFSSASVLASQHLHLINGVANVSFAGAWMGHGFHEDGFAAGLLAAQNLLKPAERCPRSLLYETETEEQVPGLHFRDRLSRESVRLVQLLLDFSSLQPSQWQQLGAFGWLWVGFLMIAALATIERFGLSKALLSVADGCLACACMKF